MKRFIIIFFALLITCPLLNAQIITGEVEYNNTFQPIEKLSWEELKNRFYDANNIENLNNILNGITELKDRKLANFSDGSYAIQYYENPLFSWYYSQNGKLINYTIKTSVNYPCKFTKFKPNGSIVNTGIRISEQESYIYSPEGRLLAHWLGKNCYDNNNNLIMTRKIME